MARLRKPLALPAVHPNAGIKAAYQRKLEALVDEMRASVLYWLKAAYRTDPPVMAMDATPAKELDAAVSLMARRWQKKFDAAAPELARWFSRRSATQADSTLHRILRDGGFSVRFKLTPAMRDVAAASVAENVQLIKSIPQKYLGDVHGAVMRSVQAGRDLASLTKEIQKLGVVTRKRAALIALDQNNKATSAILKARQIDLGITEGVWLHSHGGKEPRPTHLDNHGKKFSIVDGWFDPDPHVRKRIMPGELIRCRCVWKPVIKGFS